MVPDSISLSLAVISLIPPEPARMIGILAAVPLLIAGLTVGGIGGGDIKLTGACGMVLGAGAAFSGMVTGLVLLILFHALRTIAAKCRRKERKPGQAYPLVPFLSAGMCFILFVR
jgi:leader peptidase (prepilin peptidase)/N-methyltransferase